MSIEAILAILLLIGVVIVIVLQLMAKKDTTRETAESVNVQASVQKLEDEFTKALNHQQQERQNQASVLAAVNKSLGKLDKQIDSEVKQLNTNVSKIQEIFHNPNKRGHFGEQQLKDIIESVLPYELFDLQHTLSNKTRVDCLVKLPDPPGPIGIDSKFPAKAYEDYISADEPEQTEVLKNFRQAVLKLIKDVAEKYIVSGETSEFALIFVPSEAIYTDIHVNPELSAIIASSRQYKVYIVSPNTLMAALNTVRSIVASMQVQRDAKQVLERLGVIAQDAGRLKDRAEKFQKQITTAMNSLGQFLTSATKVHDGIKKLEEGNVDLLNGSGTEDGDSTKSIPKSE